MRELTTAKKFMRRLFALLLLYALPSLLLAQNKTITGTVSSENGQPLEGVSVVLKNTNTGTSTDENGKFSIEVGATPVLVFSFVNYETQEVNVGNQTTLSVTLKAETGTLEDVVVVGYGTQRKVNLTGSVAAISGKEIEDRPVTNLSSSLSGLSPGLYVRQGSGKPGSDAASILIRGTGTMSSNAPLVIVDGVIGVMDAVNPWDVESISILKDAASASIYGTLAANGVILITTKKGKRGKPSLSYDGIFSTTKPMNMPEFVSDYATHMRLINEGYTNVGQPRIFSDATIHIWDSTSKIPNQLNDIGVPNHIAYPNTDWADALFNNRWLQNHNVAVNGGTDNLNYLLSAGYLNNKGVIENTGTERFQIRANLNAKVSDFLTVGTQTFASTQKFDMGNTASAFNYLRQTTPGIVPFYQGKYGFPQAAEESATANGVLAFLNNTAGDDQTSRFNTTLYATITFMKGLSFESRFNYQMRQNESNSHTNVGPTERWNFATGEQKSFMPSPSDLSTSYGYDKNYQVTIDNVIRYNTQIGSDHDIGALFGYNQLYYNYYDFNATKQGLIDYSITVPGAALTPTSTGGTEYDYAIRSWFGRVNYAFRGKYLLEGNLRYDGVSRFAPATRWGTFPSVSAGWRISEEAFMAGTSNWLSSLKIRGSWGQLGNNASGYYDWQATYASRLYSFNNAEASGLAVSSYANPELRWEATTNVNLGLDGTLFNNRITFDFDIYSRLTEGILASIPIPLTAGTASAPIVNTASVLNRGLEISASYNGRAGDFNFSVGGNFAYNTNEVTKYKGEFEEGYVTDAAGNKVYQSNIGAVSTGGTSRTLEGHKMGEYYIHKVYNGSGSYTNADGSVNINGGPKDGMIRTPQDLEWAKAMIAAGYKLLPSNAVRNTGLWYGDLIYADLNGDGDYGNSFDRYFTGTSSLPKYIFGLNAQVNWKNVTVSMIWAGATGHQYYWNADGYNNSYVIHGNLFPKLVVNDHYYYNDANPDDPKNNITGHYTRLKANDPQNRAVASDFWMYNASWIKLKNIQIGYTLPESWTSKAYLQKARVYFTGENLLMITKFPGLDPEIGANVGYPTMRQYAIGVNLTF